MTQNVWIMRLRDVNQKLVGGTSKDVLEFKLLLERSIFFKRLNILNTAIGLSHGSFLISSHVHLHGNHDS